MTIHAGRSSQITRAFAAFAFVAAILSGATAARAAEMLTNGNFESGSLSGWIPGLPLSSASCDTGFLVNQTGATGCTAVTGNSTWAAYNSFDGAGPKAHTIGQTIVVPAGVNAGTLTWRDAVRWRSGTMPRRFQWDLYTTGGVLIANIYTASFPGSGSQAWTTHTLDVAAAFAGRGCQTLELRASSVIPQSFTGPAGFGLDDVSLLLTGPLAISPCAPTTPPRGAIAFSATGGTGFTWTLLTNASGGSIDASTGAYVAGATPVVTDVIQVTNSTGLSSTASITVGAGLSISPATPPSTPPRGGVAFSGSGGSGTGFTWTVLTNNSGATISAAGAYTAGLTGSVMDTVRLTDSLGNTATVNVSVGAEVAVAPAGPTSSPPRGAVTFSATGGAGAITFALATSASGGSISAAGAYIAGATGSVTDVVTATDSLGNTRSVSVVVSAGLVISPVSPTTTPRGSIAFSGTGGSESGFVWTVPTNSSGATISAAGAYTAGVTGSVVDSVRLTDSLGNTADINISVGAGVGLNPASPTSPPRGALTFSATGGTGTYTFTLTTSASGGSISSAGAYTAGGTGSVTDVVNVTDSLGNTRSVSVVIGPGLTIAPDSPSTTPRGSIAFSIAGGSGTGFTWTVLPNNSGATISAAGAYTAGVTGSVMDTVRLTDSLGNTAAVNVSVGPEVGVAPAGPTSSPPRGAVTFSATGGAGAITFALTTSASGGSISAAGAYIAGATGSVTDVVTATDSLGNTRSVSVVVGAGLVISPVSPATTPRGSIAFSGTGGSESGFVWTVPTNSSGATISAAGAYTAGVTGSVADTVRLTDSLGNTADISISVGAGVGLNPASPTSPPRGALTFSATGGTGTYTFTLTTSASGGSISSTGAYTAGGTGSVTDVVNVTDSLGNTRSVSVVIGPGLAIAPDSPSTTPRGSIAFSIAGGSGSGYAWALTTNASGGEVIASTGAYSAGRTGNVTDVISVVDSLGNTRSVSVAVGAGITIAPASPTTPPLGPLAFVATGGTGSGYAWTLSTNASGGNIVAATGAYTAGSTGNSSDIVKVTDSLGNTATATVTVERGVTITPLLPNAPPLGTVRLTPSGGSGTGYAWSLSTNASGGSINAATGAYAAGANAGVADIATVRDSLGNTASVSISVGGGLSVNPVSPSLPPRGTATLFATGGSGGGYVFTLSANRSGGSITPAGVYKAGATGAVTDEVHVVDSLGNVATANVSVSARLTIRPEDTSVAPLGSETFSVAGGSGDSHAWSLATNASGASIDAATGAYTAGSTGGVTDEVRVVDSLGNVATGAVAVSAGIAISPTNAPLAPRGSRVFRATGGSGSYVFSLRFYASGASIDSSSGRYQAGSIANVIDTIRVVDSNGAGATATVHVGAGVTIAPASPSVPPLGTAALSATGGSGTGYAWTLSTNASGGRVDPSTGSYTAGATSNVADTVTVTDSLGNLATRSISVGAGIAVNPPAPTTAPRGAIAFSAMGGSGSGISWSFVTNASGGTINAATGAYTAGALGQVTDVVKASDDVGNSETAWITVGPGVSITPTASSVARGATIAFAVVGGSGIGYVWSLGTNASGSSIASGTGAYQSGQVSGTDTVHVVDSLGNTADATVTVTVVAPPVDGGVPDGGAGTPDASGGGAADAGADSGAEPYPGTPAGSGGSGCGCRVGTPTDSGGLGLAAFGLVALALLGRVAWRRRRSHQP